MYPRKRSPHNRAPGTSKWRPHDLCSGQKGGAIALVPPRLEAVAPARLWRRPIALSYAGRLARIDWFDLAVLVLLAALSMWVLLLDLVQISTHGGVWDGTQSAYVVDQLQYMAWIRDASTHVLASNLFVLHPTPHDYLQPMVAISGGLVALGATPPIALLVWQPVAVGALFVAVRGLIRAQLQGRLAVRAALVLALFAGLPSMYFDLWLPFWTWGYQEALLALACATGALLLYHRSRRGGRLLWVAALLGALASWLHPWQGEILLILLVGTEAIMWMARRGPRFWRPLPVIVATVLPLVYYALLSRLDPTWRLGQLGSTGIIPLPELLWPLAPLAVPAVLAYRRRPVNFIQAATRVWPFAAVAVYLLAENGLGSSPPHAFAGITVPLAVLAVDGLRSVRWPSLVPRRTLTALLVLALTIPVVVDKLGVAHKLVKDNKIYTADEQRALQYLARNPEPGGVLTPIHLGALVPFETGRNTYIGDCYWSLPDCRGRNVNSWLVAHWAQVWPRIARAFVMSTGARFLVKDCKGRDHIWHELHSIILSVHRFGCATVYELGQPGELVQSWPNGRQPRHPLGADLSA